MIVRPQAAAVWKRVLLVCLLSLSVLPASAANVITRSGTGTGFWSPIPGGQSAEYASWTQTGAYVGVSVAARIYSNNGALATGNAYVTNAVGPAATAANVIASTPISTTNTSFAVSTTLFTGLTLPPGTYYLVIENTTSSMSWVIDAFTPVTTTALDVIANNDGITTSETTPAYKAVLVPPFSPLQGVLFSVSGTPGSSIPTLSTWTLVAAALLLGFSGLLSMRRARQ